ncbi:MAG: sigma-70 family RNA polymerase sigma factor [Planctomycetota bacterium]
MSGNDDNRELVERAVAGDEAALAEAFELYRPRLRRMVDLRMDHRLRARADASDVLQEAFVDMAKQISSYRENQVEMPFFLWLRLVTGSRLAQVHRLHLGTEKRAVQREVPIQPAIPDASNVFLANELAGQFTSADRGLRKEDACKKMEELLNSMATEDREIIAMRHFEELSTNEIATTLGMTRSGVLKRYGRAIKRLAEAAGDPSQFKA